MPSIFTTCFVNVQCHSVLQSSWLFRRPFFKRFPHQNVVLILYLYHCNHLTSPSKFQCHYNNVSTCYSNNVENCSTVSWITLLNQRRQVERLNPVTSAHKNSAFWVPKITLSWKIFFLQFWVIFMSKSQTENSYQWTLTIDPAMKLQFCAIYQQHITICTADFIVWKYELHHRCHLSRLLLQRPVLQF